MRRNRKKRRYDLSDSRVTAPPIAAERGFDVAVQRTRLSGAGVDDDETEGEWIAVTGAVLASPPRAVQAGADQILAPSTVRDKQARPITSSEEVKRREGTTVHTDTPFRKTHSANATGAVSPHSSNVTSRPVSPRSAWSDGSDGIDGQSLRQISGRLTDARTALMTAIGRTFDFLNAYAVSPEVRAGPRWRRPIHLRVICCTCHLFWLCIHCDVTSCLNRPYRWRSR